MISRLSRLPIFVCAMVSAAVLSSCSGNLAEQRSSHLKQTESTRERAKAIDLSFKRADSYVKQHPQDAKAYLYRARVFCAAADFQSAIKDYSEAIKLGYDRDHIYAERGSCYMTLMNPEQAAEDLERAVKENPKNSNALINLSDTYFRLGKYAQAIECSEKVPEEFTHSWMAQANKAQALFAQKKYTETIAAASSALAKKNDATSEDYINLRLLKADAAQLLGNKDAAQKERDEVRALAAKTEYPKEAIAADLGSRFKNTLKTKHVTLYCENSDYAQYYSVFLENFLNYIDSRYCKLPTNMHVSVFMLADEKSFKEFMQKNFAEEQSLLGIYQHSYNSLFTYDGSGLGTLTHEMMHKVLYASFPSTENWAVEGLPSFFEKIFGYSDESASEFLVGYQNPWRIKALGDSLPSISLRQQVFQKVYKSSKYESEERLVSMFLNRHALLPKYFQLAQMGSKGRFNTYLEAAFNRDLTEIEPLWQDYLLSIKHRSAIIAKVPMSDVFWNREEFDKFFNEHAQILRNSW